MSASEQGLDGRATSPGAVTAGRARGIAAPARLPRALRHILSLEDFEAAGRRHLPRPIFGFISGAAENDHSLRGNRAAFAAHAFVPRVLIDTSGRSQSTTLFGQRYNAPFGIAPMGASALAAYEGDCVFARAAAAAGLPNIMSGSSLIPLEEVRREGPTTWFQAYIPGERPRIQALMERVERAGFDTFVVTVDVPVGANRENNVRNGYSMPLKPSPRLAWQGISHPFWLGGTFLRTLRTRGLPHFENLAATRGAPILSRHAERELGTRDALDWDDLAFIRDRWPGKLVVKGVLAPEDAKRCREAGVDGVVVSNHGGRQLDGTVASLTALPGVVAEAGDMTVMLDSGVRRGTDVLKALALGAQFVFLGRPFLYAAAVAGQAGVKHAITLLTQEIDRNMAMLGITAPQEMTPDFLVPSHVSSGDASPGRASPD